VCDSGRWMGMAGGWREMGRLEKRKHVFIKSNMTGDVEAIFTLTGKKNYLGYEILHIEKRRVKLKEDTIITTKLLNR